MKTLERKHYAPKAKAQNKIKLGKTIYFAFGVTNGINRSNYPAPYSIKDIDTAYFEFIEKITIAVGADGGQSYTYYIYKAIKKGSTIINEKVYHTQSLKVKNDSLLNKSLPEKVDDYKYEFEIN